MPGQTHKPTLNCISQRWICLLSLSLARLLLWYGLFFWWCVCSAVCVRVSFYRTGGGQQGWEQASEQVEYHWGGNNSLDSSAALRGLAWNAAGTTDRTLLLPLCWTKSGTGASMWLCISGHAGIRWHEGINRQKINKVPYTIHTWTEKQQFDICASYVSSCAWQQTVFTVQYSAEVIMWY